MGLLVNNQPPVLHGAAPCEVNFIKDKIGALALVPEGDVGKHKFDVMTEVNFLKFTRGMNLRRTHINK